jgi:hypothetical protein
MRNGGALLGLLISCSALHAEEQRPYIVMGVGVMSCGELAKEFAQDPPWTETAYFNWAQGYMTGRNIEVGKRSWRQLNATSTDQQKKLLRSYCDEHPLKSYIDAVNELYDALPSVQAQTKGSQ